MGMILSVCPAITKKKCTLMDTKQIYWSGVTGRQRPTGHGDCAQGKVSSEKWTGTNCI